MARTIEVRNKNERSRLALPPKKKAWRHEDELTAAIGKTVQLLTTQDEQYVGTLINVDQYTIQIRFAGGDKSVFTFYKSALLGFSIGEG